MFFYNLAVMKLLCRSLQSANGRVPLVVDENFTFARSVTVIGAKLIMAAEEGERSKCTVYVCIGNCATASVV